MSDLLKDVTTQENLCWAWLKAKRMYELDDMLTDDLEVADFEIKLEASLTSIAEDLRHCRYRLRPLIHLAHPRGKDDESNHRMRQYFQVAVRDQVAWIALVNIIGPSIEEKMPLWSYGNRLYRQLFFEPDMAGDKQLRFGRFRHAKGELYRPFHQAWPVYRRHILFTARRMTGDRIVLDIRDNELLEMELKTKRLPYLQKGWWKGGHNKAYWATIDFQKFYPNVSLGIVRANLCHFCDYDAEDVKELVDQLLLFPLASCDWSKEELDLAGLCPGQEHMQGLPTGLFVSGFLANTAMLSIDNAVNDKLRERQIAQFRYVDDHTVLAPTFDKLNEWLDEYLSMVKESGLNAEINEDKTEPEALRNYLKDRRKDGNVTKDQQDEAERATKININLPTPLLTKTLAKVSMIAHVEIDLQTIEEQDSLLADIEQLLLTEFPPEELRPETRMSFAMSQLCKLAANRFLHSKETWDVEEEIAAFIESSRDKERPDSTKLKKLQSNRDNAIDNQFKHLFKYLEITLDRYPERPRLWAKAVYFCLCTGYAPGLKTLFDLLRRNDDLHPRSREYMEFFILQRINRYFLHAVSTILSPDRPLCQRSAAVRFANACYEIDYVINSTQHEHSNAVKLFSECLNAYRQLAKCVRSRRRDAYDLEEVHIFLYQQGLLTTLPAFEKVIANSLNNKNVDAAAHWHVDSRITPFGAMRPSFYWRSLAPNLTLSRKEDSLLLAKWPRFLPAKVRTHFLRRLIEAAPGRLGWFADICAKATGGVVCEDIPGSKKLKLGNEDDSNHVTLDEWVQFARNLDAWDPRRSEWTSLEIINQALTSRLSFGAKGQSRVPLVPQNILIPKAWKNARQRQSFYTWEQWDGICKEEPKVKLRSTRPIDDDRYSPLWPTLSRTPEPWEDVYSSGLILLGLLRLSFDLPCSWNPEGQLRLWSRGMGYILSEIPCSSWTLAILQATVLPRNRETFFLRSLNQYRFCNADDTVNDPPEVDNVDTLKNFVEKSQQILKNHRVTVQNHKPRQLIPLSLDQIGRALFDSAAREEV